MAEPRIRPTYQVPCLMRHPFARDHWKLDLPGWGRCFALLGTTVVGTILLAGAPAAAGETSSAAGVPPEGFQKFGSAWVLPQELALKRDLAQLDEIVRRTIPLKRQLQLAVEDNADQWQKQQAASKLIDQIAVTMRSQAVGTDEEERVQRQIDQLKKANEELAQGVAPERLAGQPHVRAMLETLTLQHQQASLLIVGIERQAGEIAAQYKRLPQPTATESASSDPASLVLTPLHRPEKVEQSVKKAKTLLNLAEIPLFLHDQQKRVGVVVNEQHPTILSLVAGEGRLIVTSNMAFAAGIRPEGTLVDITLPGGKKTKARKGTLTSLRLGAVLLQEVPALVLLPADEHRGGFLGMKLLQAWNPTIADSGVALVVDPAGRVSTAAR